MDRISRKNSLALFCILIVCCSQVLKGCSRILPEKEPEKFRDYVLEEPMKYQGQIVLRMAVQQKAGHPSTEASQYFADLVEEKTKGNVRIVLSTGGSAGTEEQVLKEIEHGSLELAQVSADYLIGYNQQLTVLEMPFLYQDSAHMWRVLEGKLGGEFLTSMESRGIEGLCWYDAGARNLYTSDRIIETPEHLDKLRIQVTGSAFMMDVVSTMGAFPMDISDADMREALKNGQADGVENDITGYESGGLYRQAGYGILTEHVRIPEMIIMNYHILNQMEEADRQAIFDAAREASDYQRGLWETYEKEQMEWLESAGVTWMHLKDQEAFRQKVWPVYEIYGHSYMNLIKEIQEMVDY